MRSKTQYFCQECGYESPKWWGKCPSCQAWESFQASENREQTKNAAPLPSWTSLEKALSSSENPFWETPFSELNDVLGGGIFEGSFSLLGGPPGIGKSTLVLQIAEGLWQKSRKKTLYISGEESEKQVAARARRLSLSGILQNMAFASLSRIEDVLALAQKVPCDWVVLDSLQTLSSEKIAAPAGSVTQVREVGSALLELAKTKHKAVWLIGHVTKDGNLAGPKWIEHLVDVVLYFHAEFQKGYRVLKASKNRFGSTEETALFEMTAQGLQAIQSASLAFISPEKTLPPGVTRTLLREGRHFFLVEIEALVAPSYLQMPRRTAIGIDPARLALVLALLEKFLSLPMGKYDVYVNIQGGLKLQDAACDLALAAAILSSALQVPVPAHTLVLGELSLTGKVRPFPSLAQRKKEGEKWGFHHFWDAFSVPTVSDLLQVLKKAQNQEKQNKRGKRQKETSFDI